jgi:tripartite-type tricarboxylate transporter receptor subunit TctC
MINYASTSVGGSTHLAAEYFRIMAGINMLRVNYKGTGPALSALIAGEVHVMFPTAGSTTSHVKSGRLRALAVGSAQPSALVPGLPTISATGLPGYESVAMYGLFAPARTPEDTVARLNLEVTRVIDRAEVKERSLRAGIEATTSTPAQLAAAMKAEIASVGKIIKDGGLRAE